VECEARKEFLITILNSYKHGLMINTLEPIRSTASHDCKARTASSRVSHRYEFTHGVSKTGHVGTGTVVHFGTPQHTAYGVAGMHGYYYKVRFILFLFSPLIIISFILVDRVTM
jgi:hypothetical protein